MEELNPQNYVTPESLKKVWSVQLDLAKQLLDVCKRHNLKIWMNAGTLLGAVRHKGYIPWDDDMDFVMPREDYNKLIRLADEFQHPYFLQSYLTEKGYARGHAQLRNSLTTALLPLDLWQTFNQGIFIDIFVFDYIPDNEKTYRKIERRIHGKLNFMRRLTYDRFLTGRIRNMRRMKHLVNYFKKHSFSKEFEKVESLLTNLDRGEKRLITDAMFTTGRKFGRPDSWYAETVMLPFEDMQMPAPKEYIKELQLTYGENFMTPIMAPSLHGSVIFDTQRPYTDVLREERRKFPLLKRLKLQFKPSFLR